MAAMAAWSLSFGVAPRLASQSPLAVGALMAAAHASSSSSSSSAFSAASAASAASALLPECCSSTACAAATLVGLVGAVARRRGAVRPSAGRGYGRGRLAVHAAASATQDIVDVEDVSRPLGGFIPEILAKVEREGMACTEQRLEYSATPRQSKMAACGISGLEKAGAAQTLIAELRARGTLSADAAEVGAAVACLMLHGADEAQNIVTPHSRASPTTYGGQPKLSSSMFQEAAYCQHILHRMEGSYKSEIGTGFGSSGYWAGQAFGAPGQDGTGHPIWPELRAATQKLAEGRPDALSSLRTMGPYWNPFRFNKIVEEALLVEDEELLAFCGEVQRKELELLFDYVVTGKAAAKQAGKAASP